MTKNNDNTSHYNSHDSRIENPYKDLAKLYELDRQDRHVEFCDFRSVLIRRYQHLKSDSVDCYVSYCNERFRAAQSGKGEQLSLDIEGSK